MSVTTKLSLLFVIIGALSCLYLLFVELSSDRYICVAKFVDSGRTQTVLVKDRRYQFEVKGAKLEYKSPLLTQKESYQIKDGYPHGFIRAYIEEQLVFLVNDRELDRKIIISFCIKQ